MKNLSTKERMEYISKLVELKEFDDYFSAVIEKLEWKTIYLQNNKKVKITKKYIKENRKTLTENLKKIILLIIEIESNWYYKAKNKVSSAEWLWQWLTWNWKFSNEYMYNWKWYNQIKKWKKYSSKRTVWLTSSFWTTLKNIRNNYPDDLLDNLWFIPNSFNKKVDFSPRSLNLREQIKLLVLDLWSNGKKVKNRLWNGVWIEDYLWTALLWNKWATKEIYKIFHHTDPDKNTLDRIDSIISKYDQNLDKVS